MITVDNGPEFAGKVMDEWAYRRGIKLSFIRPGKPVENAFAESFNGWLRDECLNINWFMSVSPNPPMDTDGRREDTGRRVRKLQKRWSGLEFG